MTTKHLDAMVGQMARLDGVEDILSLPMKGDGYLNDGDVAVINIDGKTCSKVSDGSNTRYGVVKRHGIGKSGTQNGKEAYQQFDVLPVVITGSVYVKVTKPIVNIKAPVYVKTANGTEEAPLGSLSSEATDGTLFPNAAWESLSNADNLAILRLRGA